MTIPYGYCKCGCGEKAPVAPQTIRSIGRLKGQPLSYIRYHHKRVWSNGSNSPTYISWRNMLSRVLPTAVHAQWYSKKGIKVCERWRDFDCFVQDMGERPQGTTIDRIDSNRDYEPGNCRWATIKDQQNNKTSNIYVTIDGRSKTLAQWAEYAGLKQGTIYRRYEFGWRGSELLQPLQKPWSVARTKLGSLQ